MIDLMGWLCMCWFHCIDFFGILLSLIYILIDLMFFLGWCMYVLIWWYRFDCCTNCTSWSLDCLVYTFVLTNVLMYMSGALHPPAGSVSAVGYRQTTAWPVQGAAYPWPLKVWTRGESSLVLLHYVCVCVCVCRGVCVHHVFVCVCVGGGGWVCTLFVCVYRGVYSVCVCVFRGVCVHYVFVCVCV